MKPIRVVVVEDNEEIRDYLCYVLKRESDMEVAGQASNLHQALAVLKQTMPDVALVDIELETESAGIDVLKAIKQDCPGTKSIVCTIHGEDDVLFRAYAAGAIDFIEKTSSIADILDSIRRVHQNAFFLRPRIAEKIVAEFSRLKNEQEELVGTLNIFGRITNAEFDILKAVHGGMRYRQIADERYVSEVTIKTQVNRILKKFGKRRLKDVVQLLEQYRIFEIYR